MEISPKAFKTARRAVVAASKIDKPGFFVSQSTRMKTLFDLIVQLDVVLFKVHFDQLGRSSAVDDISIRSMLNGTNMMIEYMVMFRECVPNWEKECDLIDRYSRQLLSKR